MLVGAGMFVLCSCTSQGSQQKEVVTDSVSVSQVDPVIETIMSRRSIRKYKPEAVEREKMQTIVECGINAPNGMNTWGRLGINVRLLFRRSGKGNVSSCILNGHIG